MATGSMAVLRGCHSQKANNSASGGTANCWYVRTTVPVKITCHRIRKSIS